MMLRNWIITIFILFFTAQQAFSQFGNEELYKITFDSEDWKMQKIPLGISFEKYTDALDGSKDWNRFDVDLLSSDRPKSAEEYAKNLLKQDYRQIGEIWTKVFYKKFRNGFLLRGFSEDRNAKPRKSQEVAIVVLDVSSIWIECDIIYGMPKYLIDEAINICKTARLK
jgi:hypothetical protein